MDWLLAPEAAAVLLLIAIGATALYFIIPTVTDRARGRPHQVYPPPSAPSWADRVAASLGATAPVKPLRRAPRTYMPNTVRAPTRDYGTLGSTDPAEQLSCVMAAAFTPKRIMSKSEYDVFLIVERELAAARGGYRVFAQTCLGEILNSDDKAAFSAINAKRTDLLVVGPTGMPCFAVEYQGEGHHQSQAAARDAVKKEALRRAGIGYVEILHTHSVEDTQNLVRMQLRMSTSPRAN